MFCQEALAQMALSHHKKQEGKL